MRLIKLLTVTVMGATLLALNASALQILPGSATYTGGDNSNLSAAQISAIVGATVTELYKAEVDDGDSGTFGNNYNTTFMNTPTDPQDADIAHDGGGEPFISGYANLWLYVKDGQHDPAYYLINLNLAGWNGTDTLELRGFWPNGGAISHLTILGGGTSTRVPDGGATVMLLGAAIAGLGAARRFIKI